MTGTMVTNQEIHDALYPVWEACTGVLPGVTPESSGLTRVETEGGAVVTRDLAGRISVRAEFETIKSAGEIVDETVVLRFPEDTRDLSKVVINRVVDYSDGSRTGLAVPRAKLSVFVPDLLISIDPAHTQ